MPAIFLRLAANFKQDETSPLFPILINFADNPDIGVSFIAFIISNMIPFSDASQLFGDLFVLIVTGTIAGFVIRIHYAAMDEKFRSMGKVREPTSVSL